jgi:cytoskeletal protein CcmA (bactofilin family)
MRGRRLRWTSLFIPAMVVLAVILASSIALAQATQLGGKVRAGAEVVVTAGETVQGDLYASGGSVRIEGTVAGDLVAWGGQVEVSGEVSDDLIVGSGTVDISGRVGGDARLGAGRVTVGGSVGEDLVVGSGQLTLTSSGEVGEDVIFGTGQTTIDGRVEGDVLGSTGGYTKRGTVGGTENVSVREREAEAEPTVGDRILDVLQRFLSVVIVAALLLWLVPRLVEGTSETLRRRPLPSLGLGLLGLVGFAILVLVAILATVLVAIVLGLLGLGGLSATAALGLIVALIVLAFLFFFILAFGAYVAVGLWLGALALPGGGARRWGALALGVLVVVVLTSLPVIGGLLAFLVAIFGLGALILELNARRRGATPQPA